DLDEDTRRMILEESFRKDPANSAVSLALSDFYQKEKRLDPAAEKVYLAALPQRSQDSSLLALLSLLYQRRGDSEKAFHFDYQTYKVCRTKCRRYLAQGERTLEDQTCAEACARMAHQILSGLNHTDSRAILKCAFSCSRRSTKLIQKIAEHYLEEDSMSEDAIEVYRALLNLDPDNQKARQMILRVEMEKGDSRPVFRHCQTLLENNPEDEGTLDFLIKCILESGEAEERLMYFLEKLRKRFPSNDKICLALGLMYAIQKNYELNALPVYLASIRMRQDDMNLLTALARCYEDAGNLKEAAHVYERIIYSLPDDQTILIRLAHMYRKMGVETPRA
ncbi:MAG TPA: tetratricopeptide repeat protein, partial [Candidatus Sumerlaeota bacterium]|nr:tetratricopeptide repeat protein [Candidatus Sumerlaeota bacterium]